MHNFKNTTILALATLLLFLSFDFSSLSHSYISDTPNYGIQIASDDEIIPFTE